MPTTRKTSIVEIPVANRINVSVEKPIIGSGS
jgi:hypothetical protein